MLDVKCNKALYAVLPNVIVDAGQNVCLGRARLSIKAKFRSNSDLIDADRDRPSQSAALKHFGLRTSRFAPPRRVAILKFLFPIKVIKDHPGEQKFQTCAVHVGMKFISKKYFSGV